MNLIPGPATSGNPAGLDRLLSFTTITLSGGINESYKMKGFIYFCPPTASPQVLLLYLALCCSIHFHGTAGLTSFHSSDLMKPDAF